MSRVNISILLFNIVFIIGILLSKDKLPPEVPLFYGRPTGPEQLTSPVFLVLPPTIALIFTALNLAVAKKLKSEFVENLLVSISILASLISAVTLIKIISLVGNIF